MTAYIAILGNICFPVVLLFFHIINFQIQSQGFVEDEGKEP